MTRDWLRRHRRATVWTAGLVVLLLFSFTGTSYAMLRHFNDNIHQYNLTGLLGKQPHNRHPGAQNILLIGTGTPLYQGYQNDGEPTDQTHTIMVAHVQAHRKWAEIMSIPANSLVRIPSCMMGNGQLTAPTRGLLNQSFAIGNRYGNNTRLGVACLVKTIELNTKIRINHFIVINFDGLHSMVTALNGIRVCVRHAFYDPVTNFGLSAGCHWLNADQAVDYVKAIYGIDARDTRVLIHRQQALASSLIHRASDELYNLPAIYRFLNAVTQSLTIDRKLGGFTGLIRLAEELHSIPPKKVHFFTVPFYPLGSDDAGAVVWKQPEARMLFASFRNDTPASRWLLHKVGATTGWGFL